jgi:E3 ubiquitin-protein ligase RGLG
MGAGTAARRAVPSSDARIRPRAQANSRNVSFEGQDLHLLRPGVKNPYMGVAESVGRYLLGSLDGDRRVPVLGFGDSQSISHPSQVLLCGEAVGAEGILECYRRTTELFSDPRSGLAFSGPTSFAGPIRFGISEARKFPDRLSVLIIVTDGAINDTTRRVEIKGKMELDFNASPTGLAIRDAANFPLYILIVGVGDGPFEQLSYLDDYIPGRRVDNVQSVTYTDYQSRMHDQAAMDDFTRRALCELPYFLDALNKKGYTGSGASSVPAWPAPLALRLPSVAAAAAGGGGGASGSASL